MHAIVKDITRKPINLAQANMIKARKALEILFEPIAEELKTYDIPEDKQQAAIDFAMQKMLSNPDWKAPKIVRKTVDYFHLKKLPPCNQLTSPAET